MFLKVLTILLVDDLPGIPRSTCVGNQGLAEKLVVFPVQSRPKSDGGQTEQVREVVSFCELSSTWVLLTTVL